MHASIFGVIPATTTTIEMTTTTPTVKTTKMKNNKNIDTSKDMNNDMTNNKNNLCANVIGINTRVSPPTTTSR